MAGVGCEGKNAFAVSTALLKLAKLVGAFISLICFQAPFSSDLSILYELRVLPAGILFPVNTNMPAGPCFAEPGACAETVNESSIIKLNKISG